MKYCEKCGAQIVEGSVACPSCGAPVMPAAQPAMQPTIVDASQPAVETPIAAAVPATPEVAPVPVTPEVPVAQPAAPVAPAAPVPPVYTQPVAPVAAPKKKGGIPVILVIILLVVMTASGVLVGKVLFGGETSRCDNRVEGTNSNSINAPENEEKEDAEPVQVATNKEIYISGHKITVPPTYDAEVDDEDILYVYDDTYTWKAEMTLTQFLYDTISTNIESIINGFKTSGYTVEGYQEKTVEGVSLMEIKIIDPSGIKVLAAYAKVSDTYVGVVTVYNQDGADYETEKFTEAIKILKTATKTTTSRDFGTTNKNKDLISFLPTAQ